MSTGPARMPSGGKRLGMEKSDYLGDWFMSFSPRNSNSNAEGPWDHWVDFAIQILQHPATGIVRPEAHVIAHQHLEAHGFYSETGADLSDDELADLFGDES